MSSGQDGHHGDEPSADVAVGQRVAQLLRDEGIPDRDHATALADLLSISAKQARRKLRGEVGWRVDDIQHVAAHLSRSPALLLGAQPALTGEQRAAEPAHRGTLNPGTPQRCTFRLGPAIDAARHQPWQLVATQDPGGNWLITQLAAVQGSPRELRSVSDITLSPVPSAPRVAVLDDNIATADALATWLRLQGYDVDHFYELALLQAALIRAPYDAYILDWRLTGKGTVLPLIEYIRTTDEHVPVLVLTGIVTGTPGSPDEQHLVDAIRKFDLTFLEKPAKLPMLQANLDAKLRQRASPNAAA